MKNNKVSVIIPTFNRAKRIGITIKSIIDQTYENIEIIIIDDGSSDNTCEVISEIQKNNATQKEIRYVVQENLGACAARNKGLMLSTGSYIQFIDSDDFMNPMKIALQVKAMEEEHTPCAICDFMVADENGNILRYQKNNGDIHQYVRDFRSVFIMTPLIKKNSIPPGLQWNIRLQRGQDTDFILRYFCCINRWSYTPGYNCVYVHHGGKQISDSYHKGVQCMELIRYMEIYLKYNSYLIPNGNEIYHDYRSLLLKRYFTFHIKRYVKSLLPDFLIKELKKYFQ